jgi:hypothetical protein
LSATWILLLSLVLTQNPVYCCDGITCCLGQLANAPVTAAICRFSTSKRHNFKFPLLCDGRRAVAAGLYP